ncbi:MAG: 16S rRNA (cytosine(1402)-N(4))-methyltransferase RsmH [Candidatus Pelagibacter sp. TMED153]|nr:MAG: 16S rRNA (cytosine(1402)-N(4))-methyltransferase RsmH [Candidatus Pelagibacter sp. TMED153]|tara:strand:+ start:1977 stop:2990 length:1014 start_codon:yes stop_codon:yes gene_type:complete
MINPTSSSEIPHYPVMLEEVIKICSPHKGGVYIDCTFGGGGYSKKLLKYSKTKVIALDRDEFILDISRELKKDYPNRFFFYQKKFSEVNTIAKNQSVDAVVFDLGLSSIQLNNLERGFSFKSKNALDMSMGLSRISAEDVVNNFSEKRLKSIIKILGEEKEASRIVKNIVKTRLIKKISTVDQLVSIIENSKKKNYASKINPSTKTFQALRIFVNKEITELIQGIINATKILKPGGKMLIVSFHSIEDKIVKYFFSNFSSSRSKPSRYFPENSDINTSLFDKYKNKIFKPSSSEITKNPPSRSAKLRYATRSKNRFTYPNELVDKFKKYLELEGSHV